MKAAKPFVMLALAISLAGCGTTGPSANPLEPAGSALPGGATSPASVAGSDTSSAPGASDPTAAEIERLLSEAISAPVDLSDPGPALDRAEQEMKDYMRRAAGVTEQLGREGAATLTRIDAAERDLATGMAAKLQAQAASPGAGAPGAGALAMGPTRSTGPVAFARLANVVTQQPPGTTPEQAAGGESLFGAFLFTMMAPDMISGASRDANGNAGGETLTEEKTFSDGSTIRFTIVPTLAGSRLSAVVTVDIRVAGPPAHTEQATGMLSVNVCPDADGNVPLALSLGGGFSMLGGGMQYKVAVTATGHVNDAGGLAGIDVESAGNMASQPMAGDNALGTAPMYVETAYSSPAGGQPTAITPRWSSRVTAEFTRAAIGMTIGMGTLAADLAMGSAERLWTNGYCVAITVPGMEYTANVSDPTSNPPGIRNINVPTKRVDLGSEDPFTASVSHKFEGGQLRVPVTATLLTGTVSVAPSGGVPAPATFRYKAPDEQYKDALIQLGTRSKRGIAKLIVQFRTVPQGWIYAPGSALADGLMCGGTLGGDWVVNIHTNAGGITMTGKYVVTIGWDTMDGTYVYDLVQKGGDTIATWHGSGDASIVLQPDGNVSMSFEGGFTKITIKNKSGTVSTTEPGPEGQIFLWQPAGRACW